MLDRVTDPQRSGPAQINAHTTPDAHRACRRLTTTPPWLTAVLLFTAILVSEILSLHFLGENAPVWTTDAMAVATLLRYSRSFWSGFILVQMSADIAASYVTGGGLTIGVESAICDSVDVLSVSASLCVVGRSGPFFDSLGQIMKFGAVCIVAPMFTAVLGATMFQTTLALTFEKAWVTYYLGAMFGLLIVTPFVLMWTDLERFRAASRWAMVEIILLTILVGCVGWVDFGVQALPGLFVCFPFLLLAAFRGGLLGATSSAVMLVVVASWLTLSGKGEIATYPGATDFTHVFLLQLYFAAILLSSLPVAVMLEQRKLISQFQTMAELSRMARHDSLTNLPNRLLFQERLAWTQASARRDGGHTALLLLDLDRFKPVNDLHGHAAGDRLLVMVAERLLETARETDTVARLGGDEFAIVGHLADPEMARVIALRVIKALSTPFTFMDLTVQIGCSIGIAFSPSDGTDAEILVQRADAALYRAKEAGRNGIRFFETGMDDAVRQRAELEVELRQAILLDQISPRYQPIVALGNGRIAGFEMLARWAHPLRGDIPPSLFIPLAESLGLIAGLSEQLIRKACLVALTWPDDVFVSVNVSPVQLRDRALPDLMRAILAETGLTPLRLEIELTESALIDDFDLAHEILVDLKSMGIRLTLDDFGTGYSSLRHLQGLPLDKIKIDMGFVKTMMSVAASRKIVAGVIGLGHSLGLPIVAEGIEDPETAGELNLMGCDLGQGWLYGRAVTANEAAAMLTSCAVRQAPMLSHGVRDRG